MEAIIDKNVVKAHGGNFMPHVTFCTKKTLTI